VEFCQLSVKSKIVTALAELYDASAPTVAVAKTAAPANIFFHF